jgi:hypothetical protein
MLCMPSVTTTWDITQIVLLQNYNQFFVKGIGSKWWASLLIVEKHEAWEEWKSGSLLWEIIKIS